MSSFIVEKKILNILNRQGIKSMPDGRIYLDSLSLVTLILSIEEEFNLTVSTEAATKFPGITVTGLVSYVLSML